MPNLRLRHAFVAVMVMLAMLAQGTWALAGTTGNLSGTLTDSTTGKPIAAATISVVSPSQSASATTDAGGHFTILSLAPDTYDVSVTKDGYAPTSLAGVSIFADQTQTIALTTHPELKTIARVTSRAAGALIKPGQTADVYSVNAATAAKVTGLGGGGSLDQAYSAIATMPGAYVPVGGAGWYQTVYIRGGDYDQVGYEVDGVPVNRAFDNYPSSTASALGQQELQVYTGANPADSEGQGLSGFINQVIKTGTYPGFGNSDLALGGPIFYHKAMIEAGGASPSRNFSYYAGFAGYDQAYDYLDQNNGVGYQNIWGTPFGPCPPNAAQPSVTLPGCFNGSTYMGLGSGPTPWYVLGGTGYNGLEEIQDRENVVNLHFALPHKFDSGRDDLQLLWQDSDLKTWGYDKASDWAGPSTACFYAASYGFLLGNTSACTPANEAAALGAFHSYPNSLVWTGQDGGTVGLTTPAGSLAPVVKYGFPSAPADLAYGQSPIPFGTDDSVDNAIGMAKIQYQKNFGSTAYFRVYGYTVFSNWFNWGPNSANDFYSGSTPTDYELSTHTRGVSGLFADQLTPNNLLQVQGSYTDATSLRMNNLTMFFGAGGAAAVLVSSANPTAGICYTAPTVAGPATAANCDNGATTISVGGLQAAQTAGQTLDVAGGVPAGTTCGGSSCEWYLAGNGYNGRYNTVEPKFASGSIVDEWDPNDKLHINLGLRYDSFTYVPSVTNTPVRDFWTAAFNQSWCVKVGGTAERTAPGAACPAGYTAANFNDVSATQNYTVMQPRIGLTYSMDPLNVLRLNYGEYDQAPNAAFEQYDAFNANLPDANRNFFILGFNAPTHHIVPELSYNTDASWEHQLKGTDMSFKLSPFIRQTRDQIQQFYLDLKTNFVSGLNVGQQTSEGVEFQFQKGDFNRNGFSGLLSYTYTDAYVKYKAAPNGATPITTIDQQIEAYNGYTKGCAAGGSSASASQFGLPVCGATPTGVAAAPCYAAGAPDPTCTATGTIANPYWNSPTMPLYDPFGSYAPYDLFAGPAPGAGNYGSFVAPHVATLVLNYKWNKFAVTPAFQISAGSKWGYPISTLGVLPDTCTTALGATSGDPRYPYGAAGGSSYNALGCVTNGVAIPNPATGKFDPVGGFVAPTRLTISTQLSYDVSPRVSVVATLANLVDTCWGGSQGAWSAPAGIPKNWICGFGGGYSGVGINPAGNNYNPPLSTVQPFQQQSYYPGISHLPFNAYVDFKIKL
jgi:hypothetical protein